MNRYVWNGEAKYLFPTRNFKDEEKIFVPKSEYNNPIFVNILEIHEDEGIVFARLKLFYSNGTVLEGWTSLNNDPLDITNPDTLQGLKPRSLRTAGDLCQELFDGRFNQ